MQPIAHVTVAARMDDLRLARRPHAHDDAHLMPHGLLRLFSRFPRFRFRLFCDCDDRVSREGSRSSRTSCLDRWSPLVRVRPFFLCRGRHRLGFMQRRGDARRVINFQSLGSHAWFGSRDGKQDARTSKLAMRACNILKQESKQANGGTSREGSQLISLRMHRNEYEMPANVRC